MKALVIGAGPAGLMAAETLARAGLRVEIAEQMPSPARKFLMAGKSGLNITMAVPIDTFLEAYEGASPALLAAVRAFGPEEVAAWAEGLGQEMFVGSSGRVYPKVMKASPLLRAWLARLEGLGVTLHRRWRWTGGAFHFETHEGPRDIAPDVAVLACGGASWARLGSDGAWAEWVAPTTPFAPSNCALRVVWSSHMQPHFGAPIKNIALSAGAHTSRGEMILSHRGLEGSGIYALGPALRADPTLLIDLLPDLSHGEIARRLSRPRGRASLSNHLRKTLRLPPVKIAILRECVRNIAVLDPDGLAAQIKAVPLSGALAPLDEAISTAGGLRQDALEDWMIRPGVFAAGEMLDWDAPTGGYLITACLASGRAAGEAAAHWVKSRGSGPVAP